MTREEKVFQMALAIAPTIADFGIAFTRQLINEKKNPQDFTFNGKSIPTAHGELLREWAEAFVEGLEGTDERCTIQGREIQNLAKHLNRKQHEQEN